MKSNFIFVFIILLLFNPSFAEDKENSGQLVMIPSKEGERAKDLVEILNAVLEASKEKYGDFEVREYKHDVVQTRFKRMAADGKKVNLIWAVDWEDDKGYQKSLTPILYPLRKGILGYRLFLINSKKSGAFVDIENLSELQKLKALQGKDWVDTKILESAGFKVDGSVEYEGLFGMLNKKRGDFFPRGINEIFHEFKVKKENYPNIALEDKLSLYYPLPIYFWVNHKETKLIERLNYGFDKMIKDGDYDKLFWKLYKDTIEEANLKNRKIFRIDNPFLPSHTPLDKKELWFVP